MAIGVSHNDINDDEESQNHHAYVDQKLRCVPNRKVDRELVDIQNWVHVVHNRIVVTRDCQSSDETHREEAILHHLKRCSVQDVVVLHFRSVKVDNQQSVHHCLNGHDDAAHNEQCGHRDAISAHNENSGKHGGIPSLQGEVGV